ncbi:FAS-associated factor 2-like [Diadema antillarum]|uniref:FAS-associated factor 2-like n=1 Tax=Diadema antillarum TaxID=105358 RepID=UPI003A8C4022
MADESDERSLSTEQTEKLLQFQDLTGIEDMERCRNILDQHDWNIETAVQDTLNVSEGRPTVYDRSTPSSQQPVRTPEVNTHPRDQRVYTVARPRANMSWVQWSYAMLLLPFRLCYSTIFDILRWTLRLFWPDPRRIVTDPRGDVISFINKFEEKYGTNHPVFYRGSYSEALAEAKRDLKFLLVYLHGDDHQDTDDFCRDTLGNAEVIEYINSSLLFWIASVNTPEGYRVSLALRENTYPFLALIVLRDNKMTVVLRIEGAVTGEQLLERLRRTTSETEGYLVAMRMERQERNLANTLRQEQDAAYQESLRQDQEKARKKREEQEQKEKEEQERRDEEEERQKKKEDRARLRIEKAANLEDEPDGSNPDAIKILFKLPDGKRLERGFLKTSSLEVLYDFVFVQDGVPEEFQLQTNYPRRILQCLPQEESATVPTIGEAGLSQREMLYVQDISD